MAEVGSNVHKIVLAGLKRDRVRVNAKVGPRPKTITDLREKLYATYRYEVYRDTGKLHTADELTAMVDAHIKQMEEDDGQDA